MKNSLLFRVAASQLPVDLFEFGRASLAHRFAIFDPIGCH